MKINKYSLNKLKKIINIKSTININENIIYDYLRITSLRYTNINESSIRNVLYFPITLNKQWVEGGWINKSLNLKKYINKIIEEHPNYTYVVEPNMVNKITNKKVKLIVVDNIMKSIDDLYKYMISTNKFKVVAVTGSVGKTTTVGMIEKVLKTKYKVLRIYSDRITPIILKAYIINYLNAKIDIVTLEMAIFYKNHVEVLSNLLKPDYAAVINIGDAHLGTGGLNTIADICKYKSKIFQYAKHGYINTDNQYLKKLNLKNNNLYYNNELICSTKLSHLQNISLSDCKIVDNTIILKRNIINVPILTNQSIICILFSFAIGKKLNIPEKKITKAINNFTFVEHRLQRVKIFGKNVIFDGDSSFKERLHQLSLNLYDKSYLVIRKYGNKDYKDDFIGIKKYFKNFNKVFLFSDIEYLMELKNTKNVIVVNNHDFMKDLDGEIFYHYNDYFYTYQDSKVLEENLK